MISVPRLWLFAAVLLLAACGEQGSTTASAPVDFTASTACVLDGMLLAEHPGPKAQIHYEGAAAPDFFCDTVEMFNVYLQPEQVRPVRALYVQDMGKADWDAPRGQWIDARSAFYVVGSKRRGSMGPTIASFAEREAAARFAGEYGGEVLPFGEIKPEMAILDGGALHDQHM
ncbi:MAG TPA: nitrous oxide reductase accessory protein NosL [Gammaproteobacteria bacterium]|nr:nitrous oxide reductase accessory protein NosL [Gammaproteobacteria bacterium]